ncbi:MAG: glycosyltransferase family 1 protein [bacterium]|nr:glycosyltransferase family 1 protein [bacterium]
MTIGIDISPACRKQKTGIEWYAWHIARGLLAKATGDTQFRLYSDVSVDEELRNANTCVLRWPTKYFWPETRLTAEMIVRPPDLLFVPSRALPLVLPKKTVTTIHDVGFIPFPDERKALSRAYLLATSRRAAQRADHIITVSQFAKDEIVKYFHIPSEKITVTHLGYDKARYVPGSGKTAKPYILCVGRRERRKNLIRLVAAYELLREQMKDDAPDLVIVGPAGHHASEIDRAIANSPARDSIRVRDWVSEEEKIALLQNAACLVQPSLYEGFGLPVIEAQACGTPVACSNTASLPEIAGSGALYFDPLSPVDIAENVFRLITNTDTRKDIREKGLKNAQRFDWDTTAEQTLEVLHTALRG